MFDYQSEAAARLAWRPMNQSAPVLLASTNGHAVLHFPCNFAGTKLERASWDCAVDMDLRSCRGLEFQVCCPDASPVSYFSLYLQSGEGWYHGTFYPEASNDWGTIRLDKSAFHTEGQPAGWGRIRTLRVSAWRALDRDTAFALRSWRLRGVLGQDAWVALVRADSAAQASPGAARNVDRFTDTTARALERAGLAAAVTSDQDLDSNQLAGAKLVILPSGARVPETAAAAFAQFTRSGGKLLNLGPTNFLVASSRSPTNNPDQRARQLLELAGSLVPDLWRTAAETSLRRVGVIGTAKDFAQAESMLAPLATNPLEAKAALETARAAYTNAQSCLARGEFSSAIDQAAAARRSLVEAWCRAQPAVPGEFRAFWCHSAFGVEGMSWDEAAGRLAQAGFTAVLPNMLWGGVAFYPSKVLPVAPAVTERGDQIAQCLAAAHRHGLQVHIWKVDWNLGAAAPPEFVEKTRQADRLQANARGEETLWLCPSHPANQKLEIDALLEVARRYDIDGLHFDYIRYPDSDHCFCAGCRKRFQRAIRSNVAHWPQDVLAGGKWHTQWLGWRRRNITTVVRAVSQQAHALKPNLKISAAVFGNWAVDRDGIGQDWKLWCERGWLDFVCPMDYTASAGQFNNLVARQVQWAGRTPCYPGIGQSASTSRLGVDGVIEQINVTRRYHTGGFVIFNYGVPEANDLLPLLGLGITARR